MKWVWTIKHNLWRILVTIPFTVFTGTVTWYNTSNIRKKSVTLFDMYWTFTYWVGKSFGVLFSTKHFVLSLSRCSGGRKKQEHCLYIIHLLCFAYWRCYTTLQALSSVLLVQITSALCSKCNVEKNKEGKGSVWKKIDTWMDPQKGRRLVVEIVRGTRLLNFRVPEECGLTRNVNHFYTYKWKGIGSLLL